MKSGGKGRQGEEISAGKLKSQRTNGNRVFFKGKTDEGETLGKG